MFFIIYNMIDVAVIVEPRMHKYLKPVIDNALRNLDNNTTIHIFHGNVNKDFLQKNYNNEISRNKILLTNLNINNMTVREYSNMLTTVLFWEQIYGENILIFQTDSCICTHVNDFNLSQYDQYGFVGAPCKRFPSTWMNGGFSLRKRSLMIKAISSKTQHESTWPEDKFFSLIKKHITMPSAYENALNFSVEKYYSAKPFGIHKTWEYLEKKDWVQLKLNCPEITRVFDL